MAGPAIRCVDFVESVTDWMEGAMGDDARVEFEEHIVLCPGCSTYLEQLRQSIAALGDLHRRSIAPPPAARQALLEAFRRSRGQTS